MESANEAVFGGSNPGSLQAFVIVQGTYICSMCLEGQI
jgi:hypothetical protein